MEPNYLDQYKSYYNKCVERLSRGKPSGPGTVGQEKLTNIFMRCWEPHI